MKFSDRVWQFHAQSTELSNGARFYQTGRGIIKWGRYMIKRGREIISIKMMWLNCVFVLDEYICAKKKEVMESRKYEDCTWGYTERK